jgi:hypothetical protein
MDHPSSAEQAVLVSVDSLQALQRAFPNYFLDTERFADTLSEVLMALSDAHAGLAHFAGVGSERRRRVGPLYAAASSWKCLAEKVGLHGPTRSQAAPALGPAVSMRGAACRSAQISTGGDDHASDLRHSPRLMPAALDLQINGGDAWQGFSTRGNSGESA